MKRLLLALALVVSMSAYASAAPILIDLRTENSGTINGAEFIFSKQQPTGTGVFNTFLRIQNDGSEQGYNTDATGKLPFDTKSGKHTHSLLISSLVAPGDYYEFLLDIGEPNTLSDRLLSLDGLKFYSTGNKDQNDTIITGTLLYDMDSDENNQFVDNTVLLDANREGNPGNGVSDMLLRVPVEYFTPVDPDEPYLILWSQFGLYSGAASNGTFEEWAHVGRGGSEPIPEPGTILLLGAGLAGLALYRRQSNR